MVKINLNMMEHKFQTLQENCSMNRSFESVTEYILNEADNDPDFFRWLYDDPDLPDFYNPDEATFKDFIELCKCLQKN